MSELARLFKVEPDAVKCPFPIYDHLREEGRVQYLEDLDCYVVTGYNEAASILQDHQTFSTEDVSGRRAAALKTLKENGHAGQELPPSGRVTTFLLSAPEPEHARRRSLVERAFLPPRVREYEDNIRQLTNALIDDFGDGPVDFSSAFAVPLPLTVIAALIGIPVEDVPAFKRWSAAIISAVGANLSPEMEARTQEVMNQFNPYIESLLEQRRQAPKDDVLSDVARALQAGEMSNQDALNFTRELLVAGHETTSNHLTNTMVLVLDHPGTWERLRADRGLARKFIEESLRMEAPIQGFYRIAKADAEIGGVAIPEGARVYVSFQAANRDPKMFPDPAALEVARQNAARHITFGRGPHTCIGAPLARAEGRIALDVLLDRFAHVELVDPDESLEYHHTYINRGPIRLNCLFTPA